MPWTQPLVDTLDQGAKFSTVVPAYDSSKKREQLVVAARSLFHEQGFYRTTLADVAARARVPLGNVHYYFKTKGALGHAVIADHEAGLHATFAAWSESESDPLRRLKRLVLGPLSSQSSIIRFGCPHGSLCYELKKLGEDPALAKAAARLLEVYVGWSEQQLVALGQGKREARELALQLVASQQGVLLMAHSLRSRQVLKRQLQRLAQWLEKSVSPLTAARTSNVSKGLGKRSNARLDPASRSAN